MARVLTACLASCLLAALGPAQGFLVAEGGGSISAGGFADRVFAWMLDRSSQRRVLILGTAGSDPAAEAVFRAQGARSVQQLALTAGNTNQTAVEQTILAADVLWFRGGNQADYVRRLAGSRAEAAVRTVFAGGGVVGGTSAGAMILGRYDYDATQGGVSPAAALRDPFDRSITLSDRILPLGNALFDTHFTERGRIGRLPVFLARLAAAGAGDLLGIGVDDRTALCIDPAGVGSVIGEGQVTVQHLAPGATTVLRPGVPPTITPIRHTQLLEGYRYDLNARRVLTAPGYAMPITTATPPPTVARRTLTGALGERTLGSLVLEDGGDPSALFYGALTLAPGQGAFTSTLVTRDSFDLSFDENRIGGTQWAMATRPRLLGVHLHGSQRVDAFDGRMLRLAAGDTALVLLDGTGVQRAALSRYRSSSRSTGPRQSTALEGCALHILGRGLPFDVATGMAVPATSFGAGTAGCSGTHRWQTFGAPQLGNAAFAIRVDRVPPSSAGLALLGTQLLLDGETTLVPGLTLHLAPLPGTLALPWPSATAGVADLTLPVPAAAAVVGVTLGVQGLWPWPAGACRPSPQGFSSTPGLTLWVTP